MRTRRVGLLLAAGLWACSLLPGPDDASAHGLPRDAWVIRADAAGGDATPLSYVSGSGTTAWLPG